MHAEDAPARKRPRLAFYSDVDMPDAVSGEYQNCSQWRYALAPPATVFLSAEDRPRLRWNTIQSLCVMASTFKRLIVQLRGHTQTPRSR